jgi:hypothetical protein
MTATSADNAIAAQRSKELRQTSELIRFLYEGGRAGRRHEHNQPLRAVLEIVEKRRHERGAVGPRFTQRGGAVRDAAVTPHQRSDRTGLPGFKNADLYPFEAVAHATSFDLGLPDT